MVKLWAKAANSIEGYNMEIFNLGSTQDPLFTLIGNTQFDTKKGTVFSPSPFVKAIQTPNTVIVLDEISRAHPEAHKYSYDRIGCGTEIPQIG